LSYQGNEFFIGFPEHVHNANTLLLYVHTSNVNPVSFTVTSGDGIFTYKSSTSYNNDPSTVTVPINYEVRGREYSWRNKGIHITSSLAPISVVAWSYYMPEASIMSYLALPCYDQPTNSYTYYVISTYGLSNQMSQFLIVGCTDNTSVTIIPNNNITVPVDPQSNTSIDTVIGPGQTYNFTLHSLQTIFIYEPYVDLTGSKIISDKPLTIISGHEASQVPQGYFDADTIATQLIPTINWGKTFLLPPHFGRSNGQSYRIIAIHENTTAVRTCGLSTINISFDSNNTNWFVTSSNTYCSILSNKPICVYQIGVSSVYNGGTNGDPTLNTIPPMEQYDHSAIITSFSYVVNYYSVVIPNDEYYTGQLKINGYNQNITFIEIYNSSGSVIGYGYSSSFTNTSTIEHPLPDGRLFVSIYGWRSHSGYAYNGGMTLNPINVEDVSVIDNVFITPTYNISTITLMCFADGATTYKWTDVIAGEVISNTSTYTTTDITNGYYQCTASNRAGSKSATIKGINSFNCEIK
jgi:hypothetical protein